MEIGVPLSYNTFICMEDIKRKLKHFFWILVDLKSWGTVGLELKHAPGCMIVQNLLNLK